MAKFTDDDIAEIVNALRREEGKFAFLTGAGCSLSAGIPSGAKMAADICAAYPHETRRLSDAEKANYALCMACLPIETRKKIINDYLKSPEVKLNWAHIALASLMHGNFVSRVLTFNFDSLLTRACGLLGLYPATYDFGIAPSTKTRHLAKPSIVHLHGQGSGSVLLNTEKETEKHAVELEPLLSDTFANYPMVVMGYSGESDKVFDKIKALYKGDQCLYWLGHAEEPAPHLASFINDVDGSGYCRYIGGADADQFLIQLAQKLNCFPPQVFSDPAGHLLTEMKDIAPYPLKDAGTTDILENTIERLKTHQAALQFTPNQKAVLSNNPVDIDTNDKDIPIEIQAWSLVELGNEHYDVAKKTNSISEYEKAAQQYEAAFKIKPVMHEALYNWGKALSDLAKLQNDPALFKASFAKYEAALNIKPDKHEALVDWGAALLYLAILQNDAALFKASFAKSEAALNIKPDAHNAFNNWGIALSALAKLQNDPALFKASFAKYEAALKIKPDKHEALNNWGLALSDLAKLQNDPDLFKVSFVKFEMAHNIKPDFHEALNNWGSALVEAWQLTKDEKYLEKATEVVSKAEKLIPDKCFNGACLAAIKNDEEGCKERLFKAKAAKTLPPRKHLEEDDDLANMRDKPWFAELLKDL